MKSYWGFYLGRIGFTSWSHYHLKWLFHGVIAGGYIAYDMPPNAIISEIIWESVKIFSKFNNPRIFLSLVPMTLLSKVSKFKQ